MKYLNIKTVMVGFFALLFACGFGLGAQADTTNCTVLSSSLYMGRNDYTTGGDVTRLQTFLAQQGYFTYTGPKGYFGQITFNSVVNFQRARGVSPIGIVGPLTRAEIQRVSCGGTSNTFQINSISPNSGLVDTAVTVYGSGFRNDDLILFGNAAAGRISYTNGTSFTFNIPTALNPVCFYTTPRCMTFAASMRTTPGNYDVSVRNANGDTNKINFTVNDTSNTSPHIDYLSPTSGVVNTSVTIYGTGFSSANSVSFGGLNIGSFVANNSSITFTVPQYLTPYCPPYSMCPMYMRMVTPGNYEVIVSNSNGTSNISSFTVTSGSSNSVSISGIDAPSQLKVGQSGTWAVHATDGSGSNLSYSVVWGDEANYYPYTMNASSGSVSQSTTFTHTYNSTGTYSPRFTVTNNSGSSANVSSSVNVTN